MRLLWIAGLSALPALAGVGCEQGPSSTSTGGGNTASSTSGAGGLASSSSSASSSTSAASSTGAASSTTASAGGASASSASSSGTGPSPENCTNGVDDDGNGKIDCADPACAAYGCVPAAPGGWSGPVAVYDGDPTTVPPCPAEHPTTVYQGHAALVPTPAVCDACTCAVPQVACAPGPLSFTSDAACATAQGSAVQPAPGQCGGLVPPSGTHGITAGAPAVTAGACAPGGGGKTLPPAVWGRAGLFCVGGGLGGGCAPGELCSGTPVAPFVPALCIYRTGDVACPTGFGDKHLFVDSVVDTRGCGPCACGAPRASCTATTEVYAGGNCAGQGVLVANDGSCTVASGNLSSLKVAVSAMGGCAPAGGQPTGTLAEGTQKTTACCAQ